MTTTTLTDDLLVELDQRAGNGLTVTLLYERLTHTRVLDVVDIKPGGGTFRTEVAPVDATFAFHHPFLFAPADLRAERIALYAAVEDDSHSDDEPIQFA